MPRTLFATINTALLLRLKKERLIKAMLANKRSCRGTEGIDWKEEGTTNEDDEDELWHIDDLD